ncbi:MAG TPA: hypothetical protein VGB77_00890 [Abditibacteriaceae bacterium]|jgi:hypothetical protein
MQYFSVSNSVTHNPNDVHAGRLFCWSGALVTLSIWGTMQFFEGQNHNWNRQHPHRKPMMVDQEMSLPPAPEALAIIKRVHERRHRRAALAKRPQTR